MRPGLELKTNKPTASCWGERYAVSVLLPRNVRYDLAGLGIDHHRMSCPGNKQPMRLRVDGEIIPAALATDLKCLQDLPGPLRVCQWTIE